MRRIHIARWDDFQHPDTARTSNMPWLRDYVRQLDDYEYTELTPYQQALLQYLRREYARTRREVPDDPSWLTGRWGHRVTRASLDALNHAGFIHFTASSLQAERKQPASLKGEETEKEPRPEGPKGPELRLVAGAETTADVAGDVVLEGDAAGGEDVGEDGEAELGRLGDSAEFRRVLDDLFPGEGEAQAK